MSICRHDYASDAFAYIVDGEPVTWFDPQGPRSRSGIDPDRFVEEMREVGLNSDHDFDGPRIDFDSQFVRSGKQDHRTSLVRRHVGPSIPRCSTR
ncbi:DUF6461 domain-containing protein [Nonomuraea sp. NPDC003754]